MSDPSSPKGAFSASANSGSHQQENGITEKRDWRQPREPEALAHLLEAFKATTHSMPSPAWFAESPKWFNGAAWNADVDIVLGGLEISTKNREPDILGYLSEIVSPELRRDATVLHDLMINSLSREAVQSHLHPLDDQEILRFAKIADLQGCARYFLTVSHSNGWSDAVYEYADGTLYIWTDSLLGERLDKGSRINVGDYLDRTKSIHLPLKGEAPII
jgi:hypothetical protein